MRDVLNELVKTINEIALSVLQKQLSQCEAPENFPQVPASLLTSLKEAGFDPAEVEKDSRKLSTALLLLTLLFDEARMSCAQAIDEGKLMETIIQLLSVSQEKVTFFGICAYNSFKSKIRATNALMAKFWGIIDTPSVVTKCSKDF